MMARATARVALAVNSHVRKVLNVNLAAVSASVFQCTDIVGRQCATTIKLCQQLLLIGHHDLSRGAGHLQSTCAHREVLAEWLRMAIHSENTVYPAGLRSVEVLATKVKERYMILPRRLHIGDQCQDMRDSHFTRTTSVNATAVHTTRSFYHPEVFA